MRPRERIALAIRLTYEHIKRETDRDNIFARGMAYEGYYGGYAQALNDVMLVLNHVTPNDTRVSDFWPERKPKAKHEERPD